MYMPLSGVLRRNFVSDGVYYIIFDTGSLVYLRKLCVKKKKRLREICMGKQGETHTSMVRGGGGSHIDMVYMSTKHPHSSALRKNWPNWVTIG